MFRSVTFVVFPSVLNVTTDALVREVNVQPVEPVFTRSAFTPAGEVYAVVEPVTGVKRAEYPSPDVNNTPVGAVERVPAESAARVHRGATNPALVSVERELKLIPNPTVLLTPGKERALTLRERLPVPTSMEPLTWSLICTGNRVPPGRAPSNPSVETSPDGRAAKDGAAAPNDSLEKMAGAKFLQTLLSPKAKR